MTEQTKGPDEREALQHLEETTPFKDGRYQVELPLRNDMDKLPDSTCEEVPKSATVILWMGSPTKENKDELNDLISSSSDVKEAFAVTTTARAILAEAG